MTVRKSLSVVCALLLSGCAHDAPRRPAPAETPVVSSDEGNAKPLPPIDPTKPLAHAAEIKSESKGMDCVTQLGADKCLRAETRLGCATASDAELPDYCIATRIKRGLPPLPPR